MNAGRRNRIEVAKNHLQTAFTILDEVATEEQDAFDNMPEGLQASEKGEKCSEYADKLREMADQIEEYTNEDFSE